MSGGFFFLFKKFELIMPVHEQAHKLWARSLPLRLELESLGALQEQLILTYLVSFLFTTNVARLGLKPIPVNHVCVVCERD